jgi:hypothetical protein
MNSKNKNRQGMRGSSLLEAVIAIGVLGIVVGAASTYFAKSGTLLRVENLKEVEAGVAANLQAALSNPEAMNKTLTFGAGGAAFQQLQMCVLGAPVGQSCVATSAATFNEIDLRSAEMDEASGAPNRLSGAGVAFDTDGKPCVQSPGHPNCIFTTRVRFWATCPLDTSTPPKPQKKCQRAAYVNFKFQVRVEDASQVFKQKGLKLPNLPLDKDYMSDAATGAMRMRVADINARSEGLCDDPKDPKTKYLKMFGFDGNGKPICRCLDGSSTLPCQAQECKCNPKEDPNGCKVKKGQKAPTMVMVGFRATDLTDKKGQKIGEVLEPDCISDASCDSTDPKILAKCPCMDVDLSKSGDCGKGFWMVSIKYGECSATTEKDKGGPETVKCTKKEGRCCKLDVQ